MFEKEIIGSYVYGAEVRTNGQLSLLRPGNSSILEFLSF